MSNHHWWAPKPSASERERFEKKVVVEPAPEGSGLTTSCALWIGAGVHHWYRGAPRPATRVWLHMQGGVPDGYLTKPRCGSRTCLSHRRDTGLVRKDRRPAEVPSEFGNLPVSHGRGLGLTRDTSCYSCGSQFDPEHGRNDVLCDDCVEPGMNPPRGAAQRRLVVTEDVLIAAIDAGVAIEDVVSPTHLPITLVSAADLRADEECNVGRVLFLDGGGR